MERKVRKEQVMEQTNERRENLRSKVYENLYLICLISYMTQAYRRSPCIDFVGVSVATTVVLYSH